MSSVLARDQVTQAGGRCFPASISQRSYHVTLIKRLLLGVVGDGTMASRTELSREAIITTIMNARSTNFRLQTSVDLATG